MSVPVNEVMPATAVWTKSINLIASPGHESIVQGVGVDDMLVNDTLSYHSAVFVSDVGLSSGTIPWPLVTVWSVQWALWHGRACHSTAATDKGFSIWPGKVH